VLPGALHQSAVDAASRGPGQCAQLARQVKVIRKYSAGTSRLPLALEPLLALVLLAVRTGAVAARVRHTRCSAHSAALREQSAGPCGVRQRSIARSAWALLGSRCGRASAVVGLEALDDCASVITGTPSPSPG
jgi:hypothetical protein